MRHTDGAREMERSEERRDTVILVVHVRGHGKGQEAEGGDRRRGRRERGRRETGETGEGGDRDGRDGRGRGRGRGETGETGEGERGGREWRGQVEGKQ